MFGREGLPTPLGQAFAEYERIAKTLHLLSVVDPVDDTYRRQMNRQLTVQELRHKLARDICHGKRGPIMQAYRTGQEDQLGALGLVLNAAVLWTTRHLDASVAHLRALRAEERVHDVLDEDVARVSPLKHANLNCRGRYSFAARTPRSGLRPLRDAVTVQRPCVRRSRAAMRRERPRGQAGRGGRCCGRRGSREPASLSRCATVR